MTYYGRVYGGKLAGVIRVLFDGTHPIGVWVVRPGRGWVNFPDGAAGLFSGEMGPEDAISRKRALVFLRKLKGSPDELDVDPGVAAPA